jgi:Asp-tRNA(Asn)/Glu-tRNA(Gln) amidotransferase A subunit family amidase
VVGLKPTWSRVSERGVFDLSWSVGHVGPIGATVRDCALVYAAIAGEDPEDSRSWAQPTPERVARALVDDDLTGLRVGVYEPYFADAEPAIVAACERAVAALVTRGATRQTLTVEHLELCRVAHVITIASEMLAAMGPYLRDHQRELGLDVRINLAVASTFTATDYVNAQRARTRITRHWSELLALENGVDVIVTPTTAITAPPLQADALGRGESDLVTLSRIMRFAQPANMTGFPAITVPAGYDADALPIGVQFTARPWAERTLLKVASTLERELPRERPRRHYDLLES